MKTCSFRWQEPPVGRNGQTGGGRTLAISCYRGCAMLPGGPEMEPYAVTEPRVYLEYGCWGRSGFIVYPTEGDDCCAGRDALPIPLPAPARLKPAHTAPCR